METSNIVVNLRSLVGKYPVTDDEEQAIENAIKIVNSHRTGEWNWSGNNGNGKNYYNCSVCGRLIEANREELIKFPYCHCGAKMEVKKEKLAYEK